jgi:hypothetical protein
MMCIMMVSACWFLLQRQRRCSASQTTVARIPSDVHRLSVPPLRFPSSLTPRLIPTAMLSEQAGTCTTELDELQPGWEPEPELSLAHPPEEENVSPVLPKLCSSCLELQPQTHFSARQLKLKGKRRCGSCVTGAKAMMMAASYTHDAMNANQMHSAMARPAAAPGGPILSAISAPSQRQHDMYGIMQEEYEEEVKDDAGWCSSAEYSGCRVQPSSDSSNTKGGRRPEQLTGSASQLMSLHLKTGVIFPGRQCRLSCKQPAEKCVESTATSSSQSESRPVSSESAHRCNDSLCTHMYNVWDDGVRGPCCNSRLCARAFFLRSSAAHVLKVTNGTATLRGYYKGDRNPNGQAHGMGTVYDENLFPIMWGAWRNGELHGYGKLQNNVHIDLTDHVDSLIAQCSHCRPSSDTLILFRLLPQV